MQLKYYGRVIVAAHTCDFIEHCQIEKHHSSCIMAINVYYLTSRMLWHTATMNCSGLWPQIATVAKVTILVGAEQISQNSHRIISVFD